MSASSLSRRQALRSFASLSAAVLFARHVALADAAKPFVEEPPRDFGFATAPVNTTSLGSGLSAVAGPGGNITVLAAGAAASLVIDSGIPQRGEDVVKAVTAAAGGLLPATLINTHYHFDHTGGNPALAAAGVKTIIGHEQCLARVSSAQHNTFFNMDFPALEPEAARPNKTFADRFEVKSSGAPAAELVRVDPAHTDGDIYVRFPDANVLVAGDLFFNGAYPFIDLDAKGSLDGMIAAAERLLGLVDEKSKIVPGHGPVGGKAELSAYRDMLATVRDRLAALATQGVPLQEAQSRRPLADLDPTWGQRAFHGSNFIHLVYPPMLKS